MGIGGTVWGHCNYLKIQNHLADIVAPSELLLRNTTNRRTTWSSRKFNDESEFNVCLE